MPFFAHFGLVDFQFARHLPGSTPSAAVPPSPRSDPVRGPPPVQGDAKNGISNQDIESSASVNK